MTGPAGGSALAGRSMDDGRVRITLLVHELMLPAIPGICAPVWSGPAHSYSLFHDGAIIAYLQGLTRSQLRVGGLLPGLVVLDHVARASALIAAQQSLKQLIFIELLCQRPGATCRQSGA